MINKIITSGGLRVTRNVPFGPHPRHRMDIYQPPAKRCATSLREGRDESLPVIVYVYGGIWQFGDRRDYEFLASSLARQGFVVVVPDYRVFPDVIFPRFLDDKAAAVAWVFENIATFGGSADAVFLMGHSSGAYDVVMLGLDGKYLAAAGADAARIAGVIGMSGPYELQPSYDPVMHEIFSGPKDLRVFQPISYVREDAPPALLVHGARDVLIPPRNTAVLAGLIRAAGGAVETRIYPKLGHVGIVLACLPHFAWRGPLLREIVQFVADCRNQKSSAAMVRVASL
jgi:acetyl esterase/lipase